MMDHETISIGELSASAYKVPTDFPESDGTLAWDSTTLVVVEVQAGGKRGIGYTYADPAAASLIRDKLAAVIEGKDALSIPGAWVAMVQAVRNLGRPGIASAAIAAVDAALWDLKAKVLDVALVTLLGAIRAAVPIYGSGGFTSYSEKQLQEQLGNWAQAGIGRVKMKVGREPEYDPRRVQAARKAVGPKVDLFVDANGAYSRKQALVMAHRFAETGVVWFEEPVSADDLDGLRLLRDRGPAGMDIAAGEYGYDVGYFRRMLAAGAVDVLQADATRCVGVTGFLQAGALCEAFGLPLSAHTAPSVHVHPCCSLPRVCHLEYFHDHVRIEHMMFDGVLTPTAGELRPDLSRPGLGIEFKRADAAQYAV